MTVLVHVEGHGGWARVGTTEEVISDWTGENLNMELMGLLDHVWGARGGCQE